MRIEYLQWYVPGQRAARWGTIFVWFPKEMPSEDRQQADRIGQTILSYI